jgi:hypothetical protein
MGTGFLTVKVYAGSVANPVSGAQVDISDGSSAVQTVYSDKTGNSETVSLSCPNVDYSLTPQRSVKPYSEYTVKVTKKGLQTKIVTGVQIFDTQTAIQEVYMDNQTRGVSSADEVNIYEHQLWDPYPPKTPEDPADRTEHYLRGNDLVRVLPNPIVPEYVIVHDGLPNYANAPNYQIPYVDYIKNVASSEIYPTWKPECIKANLICINSLLLNRIYLEWYPSKGYDFTITSATQFDQCFIYGRNIYKSISDIADQMFNQYIKDGSNKAPFFSQFNDGVTVNNPGWFSQWGSENLAQQGYSALGIIQYYYGASKTLATAPVVEGFPTSFPGYNMNSGMCGDPIQKLQLELNVVSSGYPLIPKINPADGKFGASTETAVRTFQEIFGLPVTGVVDFATWYKISGIFNGVSASQK